MEKASPVADPQAFQDFLAGTSHTHGFHYIQAPRLSVTQSRAHAFKKVNPWGTPVSSPHNDDEPPIHLPTSTTMSANYSSASTAVPGARRPCHERRESSKLSSTTNLPAFASPEESIGDSDSEPSVGRPKSAPADPQRSITNDGRPRSPFPRPNSYRTFQWAAYNQSFHIHDPDFPDGPPHILSPRKTRAALFSDSGENGDEPGGPDDWLFDKPAKLTVSEIGEFGPVGAVEDVWGPKQPPPGFCTCPPYLTTTAKCPLHKRRKPRAPSEHG